MPGSYSAEHQVGLDIGVTERQALCCPLYYEEGKQQQPQVDQKLKMATVLAYQGLHIHKNLCAFPFEPVPASPVNSPKRKAEGSGGDMHGLLTSGIGLPA